MSAEDLGKTFRFKLESQNEIGVATSIIGSQILASVPSAPLNAPAAQTSIDMLIVSYDDVTEDGGSDISSYSLEIDDGTGGDFEPVVG